MLKATGVGILSLGLIAIIFFAVKLDPNIAVTELSGLIQTFLYIGLLLVILSQLDQQSIAKFLGSIKEISLNKDGVNLKRHKPSPAEREEVLKVSAEPEQPEQEETLNRIVEEAEKRSQAQRSPEDYLALATRAWLRRDFTGAKMNLFAGLSLNPTERRTKAALFHRLGTVYQSEQSHEMSIAFLKEALKLDDTYSWPHNVLGMIYFGLKDYGRSEEEFLKAIKLDPENVGLYLNLSIMYHRINENDKAVETAQKALDLGVDHPRTEIARKIVEHGQYPSWFF